MKKKIWVKIIKCDIETFWYYNKIGTIHKVTDDMFPPDYIKMNKKKGPYPMIFKKDAEIINPNIIEKIKYLFKK